MIYGLLNFIGGLAILMGIIQYKEFLSYLSESAEHVWFTIVMAIIFVCMMFMPCTILEYIMDKCEDGIIGLNNIKSYWLILGKNEDNYYF